MYSQAQQSKLILTLLYQSKNVFGVYVGDDCFRSDVKK